MSIYISKKVYDFHKSEHKRLGKEYEQSDVFKMSRKDKNLCKLSGCYFVDKRMFVTFSGGNVVNVRCNGKVICDNSECHFVKPDDYEEFVEKFGEDYKRFEIDCYTYDTLESFMKTTGDFILMLNEHVDAIFQMTIVKIYDISQDIDKINEGTHFIYDLTPYDAW